MSLMEWFFGSLMEWFFGKGPEDIHQQHTTDNQQSTLVLNEERNADDIQRMNNIVSVIRGVIDGSNTSGNIIETAHNSTSKTIISYLDFKQNGKYAKITFNDLPQDDNFLCEVDLDEDPSTARDVFMVKISATNSFVIERGHYDDKGLLHFSAISHENSLKLLQFLEKVMIS